MEEAKKTYSHWFLLGWTKWQTDRWTDGQMDRQADKGKVRLAEGQRCHLGNMSTYTCVRSYLGFGRSKFKFKKKTKLFGFNFSTNLNHAEHGSFIHLGMRVVWSDNPHCSRNNVPFRRKWQSRPMKKTVSRSGGNILINSKPILKKHTRYRSEKEFPTIWVFAQLCSFNRLEVMSQYSRCTWAFCLDRTEGHKDLGTEGKRVGFYLDRQMDGWMDGWTDRRTDGWMDGWTENLPILQDFVPYRGRCPASPHKN